MKSENSGSTWQSVLLSETEYLV